MLSFDIQTNNFLMSLNITCYEFNIIIIPINFDLYSNKYNSFLNIK